MLEVARCADVCLGQPLPLHFFLFDPPGERGVHEVVHLSVVKTMRVGDFWVFDVDDSHWQRWAIRRVSPLLGSPVSFHRQVC